jgi:phosphoglycolate phosphatase
MTAMSAIYFDLDGTLTDPKIGITRSIRYALDALGCDAPPEDELTWCIGPPLRASLKTLVGSDDLAEIALASYRKRFSEIGIYENSIYPGIWPCWRRSTNPVAVCSSPPANPSSMPSVSSLTSR